MSLTRFSMFLPLLLLAACEVETPPVALPTNFNTSWAFNPVAEGAVTVTTSATGANYFSVRFGTGDDAVYVEDPTGPFEQVFTATGRYPLRMRAHVSFEHFVERWDTVDLNLDANPFLIPTSGYSSPLSYPGYNLVWQDEFNGNSLGEEWTHEVGNGNWGWGNNELQYYKASNTVFDKGCLVINAKEETTGSFNYTSSRLKTQGKKSFKYGRIDIRAALPFGQGIWPALWMLGENITSVGWPSCGEIDIMEMIGGATPNQGDERVHGTGHWSSNGNHAYTGGSIVVPNGSSYQNEFHVYSIIWDASAIKWYRDDVLYYTLDITGSDKTEFHEPMFFLMNVAVGGQWPGNPNASTVFPQRMAVDYIRVFQP